MKESFKLIEGDAKEKILSLDEGTVDLILTDPPYNLGLFMKERQTNLKALRNNHFSGKLWDNLTSEEWKKNMEFVFSELSRVSKKGASMIMFMAVIKVETIIKIAAKNNFYYKTTGIWHKRNPMPRNKDLHFINSTETWIYFTHKTKTGTYNNESKAIHDFFESGTTPKKEKKYGGHPTQKPLSILSFFIKTLTNKGDVVLDPFMGSGSTGVSCVGLSRKFIGIELLKEYYNVSKLRIHEAAEST